MSKPFLLGLALGCVISLCSATAISEETQDKESAAKFVQQWLSLVDSGNYAQTWDDLSDILKTSFTKDEWINDLKSYHEALGKLIKRTRKYITESSEPSVGNYLIFQYQSSYEKRKRVGEAVSVIKDKEKNWKVLGYGMF